VCPFEILLVKHDQLFQKIWHVFVRNVLCVHCICCSNWVLYKMGKYSVLNGNCEFYGFLPLQRRFCCYLALLYIKCCKFHEQFLIVLSTVTRLHFDYYSFVREWFHRNYIYISVPSLLVLVPAWWLWDSFTLRTYIKIWVKKFYRIICRWPSCHGRLRR
jgi:hypothetical protein